MPRRSNYLQKIVFGLERHLADGAEIEQSPLLRDRATGNDREVDIVISSDLAGRLIRVGIEVTSTRADVGWVDEMIGKHRNLPTDKLVLFSQGGFTDGAQASAEAAGAEIETLKDPEGADWPRVCGKLTQVYIAFAALTPRTGKATLRSTSDVCPAVGPESELWMEDGSAAGTFQDLASAFLGSANVLERLYERNDREDLKTFTARITVPHGLCMRDTNGRLHEIESVEICGDCRYEGTLVDMASAEYRGAQVAHGRGHLANQSLALVVSEIEDEPLKSTIVLFKSDNDPGEVLDLTPSRGGDMSSGHIERDPEVRADTSSAEAR